MKILLTKLLKIKCMTLYDDADARFFVRSGTLQTLHTQFTSMSRSKRLNEIKSTILDLSNEMLNVL